MPTEERYTVPIDTGRTLQDESVDKTLPKKPTGEFSSATKVDWPWGFCLQAIYPIRPPVFYNVNLALIA